MDGGSPPPAPDYRGAAEQTAAGNLQLLNAQTVANRPNQVTPWGTSTWSKTPTFDNSGYTQAMSDWSAKNNQGTWVPGTQGSSQWQGGESGDMVTTPGVEGHWANATADGTTAPTRDAYTTNQWTQNMVLSPQEQQALTAQQGIQNRQSQLASTLQGQVSDTMAGGFHAPSLSDYMSGVGSVHQNFGGFTPYGVGATDQSQINAGNFTGNTQAVNQNLGSNALGQQQSLWSRGQNVNTNFDSDAQHINTNAAGSTAGAGRVNLDAPQFSDASAQGYAQHAYDASTALLKPQWDQDTKQQDEKLRLQGLTPGTEAYNTAAQNLSRSQNAIQSQLANQAVQTGNNMANQNYASALAGYGAQNTAQGQAYGQDANTFTLGNTALGQQYGQDANSFGMHNAALAQQYGQDSNTMAANNAARASQYGLDANRFTTNNAARTQSLQNALSMYQASLQGQNAYNSAQNQAYGQSLAGYGANQSAQQAANAAQQQAYMQGQQGYGTAYTSALSNYLQPLNAMQAVLGGNQVAMPSMPSFSTAGNTQGADYTGATNALGQYNNGVYNSNVASANGTNAAGASAIAGIAAAFI